MTQPSTPAQSVPARPNAAATTKTLFPVDSDTHLLDRLNAVYKYRYVVVTVFLLVIIGVIVRTYTTTPMYRATTTVLVEDERGASVAGFNNQTGADYSQDTEPYFQTQLRILAGRELAGQSGGPPAPGHRARIQRPGARTGLAVVLHTMKAQAQGALGKVIGGGASAPEAPGKPVARCAGQSPARQREPGACTRQPSGQRVDHVLESPHSRRARPTPSSRNTSNRTSPCGPRPRRRA
jgi:hypothetical protein